MKKCPYCGTISDRHTIGGEGCLGRRLKHSEARHEAILDAMQEFQHNIIHNPDVSDSLRVTLLAQLNTALNNPFGEPR